MSGLHAMNSILFLAGWVGFRVSLGRVQKNGFETPPLVFVLSLSLSLSRSLFLSLCAVSVFL